mgnify:CR=1 FL=1
MTDFSSMTSEEIAGALWDAQKSVIAEESLYYGTEGRQKFIDEYSGSFSTWEGSGEQVLSEMQLEMGDMKLEQLEFNIGDFEKTEHANIEMEEKWWKDTGWIDEETGEYRESKKEMLERHREVTDELSEGEQAGEISSAVADYTTTKETAEFKQIQSGIRDPKLTERIKEELWSTVADIKANFSDEKENRELTLQRTVRDNKKNIDRGYETVEAGVSGKELQLEHAIQNKDIDDIINKEASISSWGGKLWDTIRRIQETGIFDAPPVKLDTSPDLSKKGFLWIGDKDAEGNTIGTCVLSTPAYQQDLITKEQLMSFVRWRLKTQHKEFLGDAKWLGYQMAYAPVGRLMLKYKWIAKLMKKLVLDKWLGVIEGKKFPITKFIVEYIGLIGFIFNYKRAIALGKRLKGNPKLILQAYKDLIKLKEEGKYNG